MQIPNIIFSEWFPSAKLGFLLLHSSSFLPHVNLPINSEYWRWKNKQKNSGKDP